MAPESQPNSTPPLPSDEAHKSATTRELDSADLLKGEKEVFIRHAGEVYRLRLTRNDKLILQK